VTKIINFEVNYGYICSYRYSAKTAIFDKRRINKSLFHRQCRCLPKIIPTQGQQQEAIIFVSCDKVFTEEDSCENGCITVMFGTFNIMV